MTLNTKSFSLLLMALALMTIFVALRLTITDLVTLAPTLESDYAGVIRAVARILPEACLLIAALSAIPPAVGLYRQASPDR